jgi:hypothetical protein
MFPVPSAIQFATGLFRTYATFQAFAAQEKARLEGTKPGFADSHH